MKQYNRKTGLLILLAFFAAMLIFSDAAIRSVGDHLQYALAAPRMVEAKASDSSEESNSEQTTLPNAELREAIKSLTSATEGWAGVIDRWTVMGVNPKDSVSAETTGESMDVRVTLAGEHFAQVRPLLLRFGRDFYEDELKNGERVAILDEQTAVKLFHVGDPIDLSITWHDSTYRVIGVARHQKHVGDELDSGIYIPLNSVLPLSVQLTALQVEAVPNRGGGANSLFASAMKSWRDGGKVIDLAQERVGAGLWLRVLLFLVGLTVVLRCVRRMNVEVGRFHRAYQQRLRHTYAVRLTPWIAGRVALLAIGYLLIAAALAALMNYLIRPIYSFPDWIPAVLVEWEEIGKSFWQVWQKTSVLVEYRTPELLRLRFYTLVTQIGAFGAGLILTRLLGMWRSRGEQLTGGLEAMRRGGAVISMVRADENRQDDYLQMGYVPVHGNLLRIIRADRLLLSLPPMAEDGHFVLRLLDPQIPQNDRLWDIVTRNGVLCVEETNRDYDLQLPVGMLAELVYGQGSLMNYLDNHAGHDLKMRSRAMENYFSHHLSI